MQKRKVVFIINPVAGRGRNINILPILVEKLDQIETFEYKVHISSYKGNITEIVRDYYKEGYEEFIGIGGDGTLSEIINGLEFEDDRKKRVGIIPGGTGNDFIRCFDRLTDLDSVLQRIKNEDTVQVDVGKVNSYYFINVCSFGVDGPIIKETEQLKKVLPGPIAYLVSTLKSGLFFKAKLVHLKIDHIEMSKRLLLIAVGNGKYIGGGMNICPNASPQDGYFEICVVNAVSKIKFMKEISKVYKGKLGHESEVKYYQGSEIEISDEKNEYYINADGNLIGKTPARITMIKNGLEFY